VKFFDCLLKFFFLSVKFFQENDKDSKISLGVDFTNIFVRLFSENKMKSFFGQMAFDKLTANKFGKKCTNLNLKFGVLFFGEIDQQILFVSLGNKCLVKLTLGVTYPFGK